MGCVESVAAASPQPDPRELRLLPKAQLHLHFGQASLRRSTLAEWLAAVSPDQLGEMQQAAREQLLAAAGNPERVRKYQRRLEMVTPPLTVTDVLGGCFESAEELGLMDHQRPQPGEGPVWDMQWLCVELIRTHSGGPEAAEARIIEELCEDAAAEGVRWMELAQGVKVHPDTGEVTAEEQSKWDNRLKAAAAACDSTGVGIGWVIHVPKKLEHLESLAAFVNQLERWRTPFSRGIVGVGQWGREVPAQNFQEAYSRCQSTLGLPAVVVHAGEHHLQAGLPPEEYNGVEYVRSAIGAGATRIGHGIEAAKSVEICELLCEKSVCLEVCPISNLRLGYCNQGLGTHPIKTLLQRGVPCALASDDPTFFGASSSQGLLREYFAARVLIGLSDEQLARCAQCSIEHSRAPDEIVKQAVADIDSWMSGSWS